MAGENKAKVAADNIKAINHGFLNRKMIDLDSSLMAL